MNKKRLFFLSILLALSFFCSAQTTLEVESFRLLENDVTANTGLNQKRQDGRVCALIRVKTKNKELTFNTGSLRVRETDYQKPGEIWVWVSAESRMLFISDEDENTIEFDFDGMQLQEASTYELVLNTSRKQASEVMATTKCSLNVKSDIQGDSVYINNVFVGLTPYTISLESGGYAVKVKHENYEKERNVVINNEIYKEVEFSFMRTYYVLTDNLKDAVYIDGRFKCYAHQNFPLSYGKHVVRVERKDKKYNEIEWEVEPGNEGTYEEQTAIEVQLYTPQYHFTNKPIVFATLNLGAGFLDFNSDNGYVTPYLQKYYGFTVGSVNKVGWYFSLMSNFDFRAFNADYVAQGAYYYDEETQANTYGDFVDGNYPYYSGESLGSRLSIMGGFLLKMGSRSYFRLGAGYGHRAFAFSDIDGKWVAPARFNKNGFDVAIGLQFNNKNHSVFTFDIVSTSFSTVEAKVGLGVCLHKDKVFKNTGKKN